MKIAILGGGGRMGQMIARDIIADPRGAQLVASVDHAQSPLLGRDIGEVLGLGATGVALTADRDAAFDKADVLIDFTAPPASAEHAALAAQHGKALVVGTTGLSPEQEAALKKAAEKTAILYAANMSVGVNVLLSVVAQVAKMLDDQYDIEVFEAHHRHKVDAPSGTALALARAAAAGRGVKLDEVMVPARHGYTGPRKPGDIGMSVFRGGDVVGDHTVTFAGTGERIELAHKASDRSLFAKGAVTAARFLAGKPPGLYGMKDALGLS
ncbi:MAG: 4-hydroxy-tetrahydrodipicolinate reductase [Alphaproteobacteria bacterium]|nr:4-hydroxy-tetrahydrodipicolinate reductase [Alphaproteobacteria bacterium]